jgi:hypothetical protein
MHGMHFTLKHNYLVKNMSKKKIDKGILGIGAGAGTIAILCCVSPIVLVLFGLSSVTAAIALGNNLFNNYKFYFIGASLLFLIIAIYYYLKKKNQCSVSGVRNNWNKILVMFVIAVIVYIFWYVFTTWLATLGG